MKTEIKYISLWIFLLAIFITSSNCKAPAESSEPKQIDISPDTSALVLSDTIAKVDSKKIQQPEKKASLIPLTLIIKNLASSTAPLIVGVYKSKYRFLYKEGRLKEYKFIPQGSTLTAQITDINYGEIAVALYQDMNSNGKFDKNLLGMPTEGYCFSNDFKPKTKVPTYDDCKFDYDSTTNTITMNLIK